MAKSGGRNEGFELRMLKQYWKRLVRQSINGPIDAGDTAGNQMCVLGFHRQERHAIGAENSHRPQTCAEEIGIHDQPLVRHRTRLANF